MAINQNHLSEELDGVKCAIVEKNVTKERSEFLKSILEINQYKVLIVPSPPPKSSPAPSASTENPEVVVVPPSPETFTIGVTDVRFNTINAIFGRLLKTQDGHIVTLSYWQQKDNVSLDDIPYYESR